MYICNISIICDIFNVKYNITLKDRKMSTAARSRVPHDNIQACGPARLRQAEYAALAKLYPEEEEVVTGNILAGWQGHGNATEFAGVLIQARTGSATTAASPGSPEGGSILASWWGRGGATCLAMTGADRPLQPQIVSSAIEKH